MKAKSILGLFVLVLLLLGFSAVKTSAQVVERERGKLVKLPGVVKGTIYVKTFPATISETLAAKT